jgi:hypothetical protein
MLAPSSEEIVAHDDDAVRLAAAVSEDHRRGSVVIPGSA